MLAAPKDKQELQSLLGTMNFMSTGTRHHQE